MFEQQGGDLGRGMLGQGACRRPLDLRGLRRREQRGQGLPRLGEGAMAEPGDAGRAPLARGRSAGGRGRGPSASGASSRAEASLPSGPSIGMRDRTWPPRRRPSASETASSSEAGAAPPSAWGSLADGASGLSRGGPGTDDEGERAEQGEAVPARRESTDRPGLRRSARRRSQSARGFRHAELSTAVRIQGSPASRRAIRARASTADGSSTSPRVNATWNRTRTSGSSARARTRSRSGPARSSRGSASRRACSRTPGAASSRATRRSSSRSDFRPSSDQSACSRPSGSGLRRRSRRRGSTAAWSCRSKRSRWAVSRCQALGCSSRATSSRVEARLSLGVGRDRKPGGARR